MTKRFGALVWLSLALVIASGQQGRAFLRFSDTRSGTRVFLKWNRMPIRYFISNQGVPGVTPDLLRAAVERAAQSWQTPSSSAISFQFVGFTSALPFADDGQNTVGFLNRPEFAGVLGTAVLLYDVVTGEIVESDGFLNSSFQWSVEDTAASNVFDVESVAVHELGHMLGISHSGLGEIRGNQAVAAEAAMFPYFNAGTIINRVLKADDIAAAADTYPDGGHTENTGRIAGRIQLDGRAVFGAHILAFNPSSGALIASFSLENGEFVISGLSRGRHILRVEPIDDGVVSDYFSPSAPAEVNFRTLFFERLVSVVPGSTTSGVTVVVQAK
ncbi:MAG: matrixin family metalloprotease [Acidobacteriota bacterium]